MRSSPGRLIRCAKIGPREAWESELLGSGQSSKALGHFTSNGDGYVALGLLA